MGQLQVHDGVVYYRRWFRWRAVPEQQIIYIRHWISSLALLKTRDTLLPRIFFHEPENEAVIGYQGGSGETLVGRRGEGPLGAAEKILLSLSGFGGGFMLAVVMPPFPYTIASLAALIPLIVISVLVLMTAIIVVTAGIYLLRRGDLTRRERALTVFGLSLGAGVLMSSGLVVYLG